MAALTEEQVLEFAEPMIPSWKLQNEIGFGDCPYPAPDIEFEMDNVSFYSASESRIHIGLDMARTVFHAETQEDLVSAVSFLRQHEEQHCRSTAAKPYQWAIDRGTEVVIEEIAKLAGKHPFRFRAHADYRRYVESVLPTYGIGISFSLIEHTAAAIANSLEDGRIERIRGYRFPGFAALRTRFRGLFYLSGENTFPDAAASLADPSAHLAIVMNNVLTLATCQKYQMGFILSYGGTEIQKEVDALMPDIWKGIMAPRTREMAAESVEICRKMAPLIYEAAKQAGTDKPANDALAALIGAVISAVMRGMPDDASLGEDMDGDSLGLSEKDEDTAAVRISAADNVINSECSPLHENQGRNSHTFSCQAVTCLHLFTVQYIIHSLPPPVSGNADSSGFSVIRAFSPAFPEKRPVLMNFPDLSLLRF